MVRPDRIALATAFRVLLLAATITLGPVVSIAETVLRST